MVANSKIEWTDATFNPWRGCQRVSPGCQNCYAEAMSKRNPKVLGEWGPKGTRIIASESYWKQPYKWGRQAEKEGVMKRVFCASLADVFEDHPGVVEARKRLWDVIIETRHLNWLLLTKRPENFGKFLPWMFNGKRLSKPWETVWLGVTVENQEMADKRIPLLLQTPAAVRFVSMEPLLSFVNLNAIQVNRFAYYDALSGCGIDSRNLCQSIPNVWGQKLNWIICGGESGPKARPMNAEWCRVLMRQCQDAGVAFFMKQGSQANWPDFKNFDSFPEDLQVREYPH